MVLAEYPSLFQINTRVWLKELSRNLRRPATLDDIPEATLDRLAQMGFDWVWLLSVWQTGLRGRQASRSNREWQGLHLDVALWHCQALTWRGSHNDENDDRQFR